MFIFQKINESTKGADYQLKTSSNLDMRFNIVPTTLSATKNFTHVYGVLKDITSSSNFTAEETSSVQTMVNGISSEKMCFNFNNGFYLWYNPLRTSFGDTTSVTTSESTTSTSNATAIAIAIATASVGQGSPEDSETTETDPTQLTISSGKVQVNASVPMMGDIGGTVNVASGNIKLDMSDKKLSGTVNLTSGDLSGEVLYRMPK